MKVYLNNSKQIERPLEIGDICVLKGKLSRKSEILAILIKSAEIRKFIDLETGRPVRFQEGSLVYLTSDSITELKVLLDKYDIECTLLNPEEYKLVVERI